MSRIATLYCLKCLVINKKVRYLQRDKKKQSVETVPEEAQTLDFLNKDCVPAIIN